MRSRYPVFKVALLIVVMLLVISFAFGTPILADGGGGQPFPPDEIPPSDGNSNGISLLVTVLSILQFVL